MYDGLLVVDVWAVVGHEYTGRSAIGLRVNELVERVHGRQRGGPRLYPVFAGQKRRDIRALDLTSVLPGTGKSVLEVDCQGRRRRLRRGDTGESASAKPDEHSRDHLNYFSPAYQWTILSLRNAEDGPNVGQDAILRADC
jgi:hypothetical protein